MSVATLQRVVVRMLYDAAFVDQVYADAAVALRGLDLDAEARGWLTAPDIRRWKTDPLRRFRSLQALIGEYPASCGLVIREAGGVPALDAWFSDGAFHRCIQTRGVLALRFGQWLYGQFDVELSGVARVELALARVRRAAPVAMPGGHLCTAPHVDAFFTTARAHGRYLAVRAALNSSGDPTAAVMDAARALPEAPAATGRVGLIAEQTADGATLGEGPDALVQLLAWTATPRRRDAAIAWLARHDLDATEAAETLDDLASEGLLITA